MDSETIQDLIVKLQNGDDRERRAAAFKLGRSADASAVAPLIRAYEDADSGVSRNAMDSLRRIGTRDAQAFLTSKGLSLAAPQDTDWRAVAQGCAAALGILLVSWVPAAMIDSGAGEGAGAGATLIAFFLCTPIALVLGVLVWLDRRGRHRLARERQATEQSV